MDPSRPAPTLPPGPTTPTAPTAPNVPGATRAGLGTSPHADATSPWAAPGGGSGAEGASVPLDGSLVFAPVEPPRKRHGLLFSVVAIVVLALVGVGAAFALRAGDGGDGGESVVAVEQSSAFSLAAAAQRAAEATTVEFEMSMSIGDLGDMTVTGGIDNGAGLMAMTMSMDSMLDAGLGFGDFEMIIDVGNGVMYLKTPADLGLPLDAAWISMDLAEIAEQSGMSLEEFQDQFSANPLDVASLFADVDGEFVDLGIETIDGEDLRHYVVTIDLAAALDVNPQLEQQFDFETLGAELPESIDYDVWVTEDNQLRRMVTAFDVLGQEMIVEMTVDQVDRPLDIELPDPDEVVDVTDFAGGL